MLDPKKNRIDYNNTLIPPVGYHLDFAIGTSYSLDFETLIYILSSLGNIDYESVQNNPVSLLNVLQEIGKRVVIFCENGQIKVPQHQKTSVFLLYEEIVHTVNKNDFSFHPKFWLIRYKHDQKDIYSYRLIILSRNLTFDRSWDIIFSIDGTKGKKTNNNKPIVDFLSFLDKNLKNKKKKEIINTIKDDLSSIDFKKDSIKGVEEIDFIPLGISKSYSNTNELLKPLWSKEKNALAVISPFLSKDFIKNVTIENNEKQFLISRKEEIQKICTPKDNLNLLEQFEIYALKDNIVNGESQISEEPSEFKKQDLHAKIFFVDENEGSFLYLGSANASSKAFGGNIEFLVRLKFKNRRYISLEKIKEFLGISAKNSLFEKIDITNIHSAKKQSENNDNKIIKEFVKKIQAEIKEKNGNYSILIEIEDDKFNMFEICPLFAKKQEYKSVSKKIEFENLRIEELSKFFIVKTKELSKVVEISLDNMPQFKERSEYVINKILSNKDSILQYLTLCCFGQYSNSFHTMREQQNNNEANKTINYSGLYEDLLKVAAFHPERLDFIAEFNKLNVFKNDKNELDELKLILNVINELKVK